MDLKSVIQSTITQKEKGKYHVLTRICGLWKNLICKAEMEKTGIENKYMDIKVGGIWRLGLMHIHR